MSGGAQPGVPLVEVMVPFVSGTAHLIDAIRSVQAQQVVAWRLTVIDNAGPEPDAGAAVAALGDDRVAYVRYDDHIPMADNWNRAIAASTSPWVVLLHADDEWEPHYLTETHRLIRDHPTAAACFTGGHTIGDSGADQFSLVDSYKRLLLGRGGGDLVLTGDRGASRLLRGNFVFASSICLRRAAVGPPFDTSLRFAPDYQLVLRLLLEGHTLVASRSDACRYRRHPGQATLQLTKTSQRFDEEIALYRTTGDACRDLGWRRASRTARRRTSLRTNLALHALAAVRTDHRAARRLLRQALDLS